jgi:hypothetical protein
MKNFLTLLTLLAASTAGYAQDSLQTSLIGKWQGAERNLPTVDLAIGQDTGHAIFYLLKRNSDGSNEHVDGQADTPMENLHFAANQLSFDVRHKDGAAVAFHIVLEDANHARLVREEDSANFPLVRVGE